MSRGRLRAAALLCSLVGLLLAGGASAAVIEIDNLVLHADGGFTPRALPRAHYAPIKFEGTVDLRAKDGGAPAALTQAVIDFDRDGRLDVAGLPTCAPETIAQASTEEARRACAGAIVGEGQIEALVALGGAPTPARSPLTLFNGPRLASGPSVVIHARTTVPATQTYAILVPIERRPGGFRYRATLNVPPIAGGLGAITHIEVEIGRRFNAGGRHRSYVAARCSDGILETHGRFSFADGMIIDGSVEKFCRAR
ncbi:MAG TPA: hypothetical protein VMS60_14655 [Solirubrobacterales bacterium]|nr:hypothetical protein [Solirubrobacterales bacterium]